MDTAIKDTAIKDTEQLNQPRPLYMRDIEVLVRSISCSFVQGKGS